jgi:hypothetical protein
MPIKSCIKYLGLALGLSILNIQQANACSCAESAFDNELKHTDAVFKGKILSVHLDTVNAAKGFEGLNETIYTVLISQVYKGKIVSDTVSVITGPVCGVTLGIGDSYLIYATYRYDKEKGHAPSLVTGACTRTGLFSRVDPKELEKLEQQLYSKPVKKPMQGEKDTMTMIWVILTSLLITGGVLYLWKNRRADRPA